MNTKTKAKFGQLVQHLAFKWIKPILTAQVHTVQFINQNSTK